MNLKSGWIFDSTLFSPFGSIWCHCSWPLYWCICGGCSNENVNEDHCKNHDNQESGQSSHQLMGSLVFTSPSTKTAPRGWSKPISPPDDGKTSPDQTWPWSFAAFPSATCVCRNQGWLCNGQRSRHGPKNQFPSLRSESYSSSSSSWASSSGSRHGKKSSLCHYQLPDKIMRDSLKRERKRNQRHFFTFVCIAELILYVVDREFWWLNNWFRKFCYFKHVIWQETTLSSDSLDTLERSE